MLFTTSINTNYLPKARTLAQSIKKYYPESKFILGLVEREALDISHYPEFDGVVIPSELWPEDHNKIIYQYDVVEACTAIKGQLFCYLLEKFPLENKFVFLDPDIQVMSRMTELDELLERDDIILTPHLTEPENTIEAIEDNEISVHRHGIFNLGFLAIRRSDESLRLVRWWAERLKKYSIADYYRGLFTDQKWMDQAPAFFNVHILKHPGYNVAPWNIGKRPLSYKGSELYIKGTYPLRFFHFSGFDSGANIAMISKYAQNSDPIFSIRDNYIQCLKTNGESENRSKIWSYDLTDKYNWIKRAKRILQRNKLYNNPSEQIRLPAALICFLKAKAAKIKQLNR